MTSSLSRRGILTSSVTASTSSHSPRYPAFDHISTWPTWSTFLASKTLPESTKCPPHAQTAIVASYRIYPNEKMSRFFKSLWDLISLVPTPYLIQWTALFGRQHLVERQVNEGHSSRLPLSTRWQSRHPKAFPQHPKVCPRRWGG